MDIEALRLEALRLAWACEQRPPGATYPQPKAEEVIKRAHAYLQFLQGKSADTITSQIAEALTIPPNWIKSAQKYLRDHPPQNRAKNRKPHPRRKR